MQRSEESSYPILKSNFHKYAKIGGEFLSEIPHSNFKQIIPRNWEKPLLGFSQIQTKIAQYAK